MGLAGSVAAPRRATSGSDCGYRWRQIDRGLDAYAARRSMETAVVILEPLPGS